MLKQEETGMAGKGEKETNRRYAALKSTFLRCRTLAPGELRWLYSEARRRDDGQVWPFLKYILKTKK